MTASQRARKIRQNVLELLERYPETRNSDRLLLLKYWAEYDHITFDESFPMTFMTRATTPESITRARRQIQEQGLFLPTDEEVIRRRRITEEELRAYYAQD